MFALERQKRILEILNSDGAVLVSRLASEFQVTEETVRRDLEKLEKQEVLTRTHGGAVLIDEGTYELSLEKRKKINMDSKEKVAEIAAKYIVPGDTVFLDASTTTFCMSKAIKKMKNVTVITNSIRIINELSNSENVKVIAVGGLVSNNQSFVGNVAESTIENCYFASKMFFSSKGITDDAGILDSNESECAIKQKMLSNTKTKFYVCDKSKIGRVGFVKLSTFDKINYVITDGEFDESYKEKFEEYNIEVISE